MIVFSALKKLLCLLLAFTLMLLLPVFTWAGDTYHTTTRVNFRAGASTSADIIKTLDAGAAVQVDAYDPGGWSKATVNGQSGYIKSEYIAKDAATTQTASKSSADASSHYRATARVNFRKSPSLDGEIIRTLNAGTPVELVEYEPDGWDEVTVSGTPGYIKADYLTAAPSSAAVSPADVELTPWSEATHIMTLYTPAMITDVRTGAVYWVQSFSNGMHADVEPLTKADTEIMFNTFGRHWSWAVRPVWVTINGHTMAASINGQPHASGTIPDNGMDGQICLHFKGSTTHNGNKAFAQLHQDMVMEAYYAAH